VIRNIGPGRATVAILGALALALSATACGEAEAGTASGEVDDALVAEATSNVEKYFANNEAPFELEPVKDPDALKGKTLMYLSAGLASPAGTAALKSLKEVKDKLGFELVTFDGEFTTSKYQEGMRQAVSQKVDALMVYGVDCAGNEAALKQVRDAGIKLIGLQSVDCSEVNPKAKGLFESQPLYPIGEGTGTVYEVWAADGAAQADYLISKLKGDVKVIQFDASGFAVTASLGEGFRERMADCSSCEVLETVTVELADYGPGLQQKAEQVLLKHPEANAVQIAYDDLVTLGVSSAIDSSGRKNDLMVVAGTGNEAAMDMIRKGKGLDAGWVEDYDWDHYAGVDDALRLLSGQEPAASGHPVIFYDKDNNMPESGAFVPAVDFRSTFEKAWGLQ
jgi:ribose transport system substrate-binding protein